jgi:hypothetical protein
MIKAFTSPDFIMSIAKGLVDAIVDLLGKALDQILPGGDTGPLSDEGILGIPGIPFLRKGGIIPRAANGMVSGHSFAGDRQLARVNAGEMILNKEQQSLLWEMANGKQKEQTQSQPMIINLTIGEKELASVMLDINRKGYRVAV